MKHNNIFNKVTQFALPALTIIAQIVISLKIPKFGLLINLIVQPFWIYSSWKGYKNAGQIGLFISTIIMTIVIFAGVINYWFL